MELPFLFKEIFYKLFNEPTHASVLQSKTHQKRRISELEEQNRQLQSQLKEQKERQIQDRGVSNHHYHTNSHNTTNNIINNNQFNITLPEGTWSRNLWAVMIHLISKTKGDRFTKGELEFNEAFGKTLLVIMVILNV